jgi:lysozyme
MKTIITALFISISFFVCSKKSNIKTNTNVNFVKGIDISHHQGLINWSKKDKELFSFVYIKSSEGENFKDPLFHYNFHKVRKVGLYAGAYHVYNFKRSGKKQAENFIKMVPNYKNTLPPAVDLHLISNINEKEINNVIKELKIFNKIIYNHYGKKPIFYISNEQFKKYLIGNFDNKIWTWHYTEKTKPGKFGKQKCSFWQYKIVNNKNLKYKKFTKKTGLDLDYFNGNVKEFQKFVKSN